MVVCLWDMADCWRIHTVGAGHPSRPGTLWVWNPRGTREPTRSPLPADIACRRGDVSGRGRSRPLPDPVRFSRRQSAGLYVS